MRPALWLALAVSIAASTWVLWSPPPESPGGVVAAREPVGAGARTPAAAPPLPARWAAPMLEAARRNPFGADAPSPSVAKAASAPASKLVVPQPPPVLVAAPPGAPAAAPFGYRYLGRMIDPQGQRVIYLARGENVLAVQPGTNLNDGYTVESITDSTVEVVNSATQQRHTIAIPPDASTTASSTTTP